ncbi:PucR family transcriptional regulator [Mycolicibacterium nivoides]|uniref:PucR family transcriptional regulator n=1 Tax=Mycolicibacterium nivoides TaxID=2487344 RepID=UPI0008BB94FC|nr:PucR family transcriptional regulator ligand-binding domain-containing protein [Mycolicibacterium nivoides]MBN3512728.1 PucR family transcriptional regulator [Mycolicibacterium septicum]SEP83798.1 DNA-binding transcriptional regulator, PucR family [Mycobacterium sp. 88mf]SFF18828.1 DNA-binding transcriptional regulator, PucR family [Mycobacterium sp. 455mf]
MSDRSDVIPTLRDLLESHRGLLTPDEPTGDLDRRISWVHTTELRDPSRYLHGGELVCTVGISLQTAQDCAAFVESLTRAGAAGLCFGIGDVHDTVPGALITSAARDGLPILIAPPNVPFSSVSRYVADFQVGGEISVARATNSLMPELLSSQRRRESVRQLLDRAGEVLGGYLLLDPDEAPEDTGTTTAVDGLGTLAWVGSGDPPETAVLQLIARFAQAAQGDRDIESALTRERVGQLLSLIERRMLLPDALNQLLDWAGLSSPELTCSAWPAGAGAVLSMAFPDALVGDAPEVCLVLEAGARAQAATELSMPSGHAAAVPLAELGAAITQARIALDLAQQHGGSIGPDQLSTFDSLLEGLPLSRLAPFKNQLIDPLERLDNDRGTQHVRTLRAFLATNGSLIDTARELFLHTNTVRHRLSRIHEITGRNPMSFEDQAAFAIGLRASDRARRMPGRPE